MLTTSNEKRQVRGHPTQVQSCTTTDVGLPGVKLGWTARVHAVSRWSDHIRQATRSRKNFRGQRWSVTSMVLSHTAVHLLTGQNKQSKVVRVGPGVAGTEELMLFPASNGPGLAFTSDPGNVRLLTIGVQSCQVGI